MQVSALVLAAAALSTTARAQTPPAATSVESPSEANVVEELVVTGRDKAGLIETTPSSTVFGLAKPLVETPRAATFVSDQTIERYGIVEVDDLTAITPGSFTASFYGVKGAVNLRGTLAETYFRGFKRIENRGTYSTPLGAAAQIEILRGPPSAVSGPGKVGGFLNIAPKSAAAGDGYITEPTGAAEVTGGSYSKFNVNGQVGVPLSFGEVEGGIYAYVEREDSGSFYRGIEPESTVLQVSGEFTLPGDVRLSLGAMRFEESGNVQTAGWNRLTQNLIDNQQYITGRDTTLVDTDRNGRLTPNESGSLVGFFFGFPPQPTPPFTLDTGVGVAKIDPRTVFVSAADFNETETDTLYLDLAKRLTPTSQIKAQLFYDDLENTRFVSYGFPALYDTWAVEGRVSYDFELASADGSLSAVNTVGAGYRRQHAQKAESFNGGFLSLDRRDLIFGPTPTDIFDSPFTAEPGGIGLGWDYNNHSEYEDTGVFAVSDITYGWANLTLGARYDWYDVTATDSGALTFAAVNAAEAEDGDFTYSASFSLKTPYGVIPYVTYAESSALEVGQAGDLAPSLIAADQWLSDSELKEAGIKVSLLGDTLVGALSVYQQSRTRLSIMNNVSATEGEGVELEARWLATENLSFTFAGNRQETTIKGPDGSFTYVPLNKVGVAPASGYGGSFATFNFSTFPSGYPGDYELRSIPEVVVSLYGSYITDPFSWGQAGVTAGVTHVSETSGNLQNPVVYPSYELFGASGFVSYGPYQLLVNVDNVFDELYFQPVADTYANLAVLPGRGREFRVTLKRTF